MGAVACAQSAICVLTITAKYLNHWSQCTKSLVKKYLIVLGLCVNDLAYATDSSPIGVELLSVL